MAYTRTRLYGGEGMKGETGFYFFTTGITTLNIVHGLAAIYDISVQPSGTVTTSPTIAITSYPSTTGGGYLVLTGTSGQLGTINLLGY